MIYVYSSKNKIKLIEKKLPLNFSDVSGTIFVNKIC